jgi:predicted RNA-binding protein with PIN domain
VERLHKFQMNRTLLIDGYNVINRIPELRSYLNISLETARNALVNLAVNIRRKNPKTHLIIVFDGKLVVGQNARQRNQGIDIIFSTKIEGDDELIRLVKAIRSRSEEACVISDDNYVHNNCRAHGALIYPSQYLMKLIDKYS